VAKTGGQQGGFGAAYGAPLVGMGAGAPLPPQICGTQDAARTGLRRVEERGSARYGCIFVSDWLSDIVANAAAVYVPCAVCV